METYKNFFHSYRMPHEDMDRLLPQSRRSNHIVVASCDQFYILRLGQDPLDDPYRREAQSQLNESSIFEQLLRIYRVSREHARRSHNTALGALSAQNGAQNNNNGGTNNINNNNDNSAANNASSKLLTGHSRRNGAPKIGLLTTENRKVWAKWHKRLTHYSSDHSQGSTVSNSNGPNVNTESLHQIEDCLFVMCLDSLVGNSSEPEHPNDTQMHIDDVQAANIILTGGGTKLFTANRWFDKFLQIIVGRSGVCGINIEHSASEGITVLRFLEEFLQFIRNNPIGDPSLQANKMANINSRQPPKQRFDYDAEKCDSNKQQVGADSITSPSYLEPKSPSQLLEESDKITPLMWQLDAQLSDAIDQAELRVNQMIDNFSLYILEFEQFGRAFIKKQNLSPDAFIQLALQYTFFKLHGHLVSTYESASLRQFRLGRVDNIRANTCEAYQWIQAMLKYCKMKKHSDDQGQQQQPVGDQLAQLYEGAESAFIKAITKQVEILRYTIVGGGPDNHLLALKELAKIRYGPDDLPQIFTDQSYREFLNFRLSTSQLPNESGIKVGYGAVVPDGYGCSYNPCEERIIFCISSFRDCPKTSSSTFASTLADSLEEMRQLCLLRGDRKRDPKT